MEKDNLKNETANSTNTVLAAVYVLLNDIRDERQRLENFPTVGGSPIRPQEVEFLLKIEDRLLEIYETNGC